MNVVALAAMLFTSGCAMVDVPDARNVNIPPPTQADSRKKAINERPDSVMYLPLGEDVLVPEVTADDDFPKEMVGPFELRGETLAGALQLILADYDISLAFETQEGLTRRITVANLRGDLGKVVHEVCSLANLYCSYEDGTIVVKDKQTFTVTLPPIGTDDESEFLNNVSAGLGAILTNGEDTTTTVNGSSSSSSSTTTNAPIVDPTTRTIVYSATQRTADVAARYFQRLRANTAMIVFETYIWEVSLDAGNSTGINWSQFTKFGKYNASLGLQGSVGTDFTNPISIGLPTTQDISSGTPTDLVEFLSQFGAVKTISQPQITVLSGAEAELRVADTRNYVSQIATTLDEGQSTTSVNTDSVDTGFTLTIGSTWDKATVYAKVDIELTDVKQIDDFTFADTGDDGGQTKIQLPQTSERQLSTQIRVRPGDSVLIAGLVRENDNYKTDGIGFMKPVIPQSRTAQTQNLELVIMLRPRVIVYTAENDQRYIDYALKKQGKPVPGDVSGGAGLSQKGVNPLQEEIPDGVAEPLSSMHAVPSHAASPAPAALPPISAPVPAVTPAPVSVPAVTLMPPVTAPSPSIPVAVPAPSSPAPAPAQPSWEAAPSAPMPILKDSGSGGDKPEASRFSLGSGFVSRGDAGPASSAPAPVSSGTSAVTTYPLTAPSMPAPAVVAPSEPPSSNPSPYETYDYYTPTH